MVSSAQSFSSPSPEGLITILYCFRFDTPQPWGPYLGVHIPQEKLPGNYGYHLVLILKGKTSPVTKRLSYYCKRSWRPIAGETSRLPRILDNRPTDGGEVVSLTLGPAALYLAERFPVLISVRSWGPQCSWKIQVSWKIHDLIGNQNHGLPTCSTVSEPTSLSRTPSHRILLN
jgi:hypothetical protein